jgi:CheY-like chemotaxis protein
LSNANQADRARLSCLPLLLIVDDDPEIRFLYTAILKKHFRLVVAEDGEVGLARALETPPDLILTDQNMPGCTGVEMVKRMRQISALRQIPIVVSSAYLNEELEKQFAALGIEHFLDKPCQRAELVRIVSITLIKDQSMTHPRGLAPSATA